MQGSCKTGKVPREKELPAKSHLFGVFHEENAEDHEIEERQEEVGVCVVFVLLHEEVRPEQATLTIQPIQQLHNYIKACSYTARYPVLGSAQRVLHFAPWQTYSFQLQLDFSGKLIQLAALTARRLFIHISTTVYSQVLIYTVESTGTTWSKCSMY